MELNNDAKDIVRATIVPLLETFFSVGASGVIGQAVPGIVAAMQSYKQIKSERMVMLWLTQIHNRQDELSQRLRDVEDIQREWFDKSAEYLMLEYVMENKQEEKIEYFVNGFASTVSGKITTDEQFLSYYERLKEVTSVDLLVLKRYAPYQYQSKSQVKYSAISDIDISTSTGRLLAHGLLETKTDDQQIKAAYERAVNNEQKAVGADAKYSIKHSIPVRPSLSSFGLDFICFFYERMQTNENLD